MLLGVPKEIKIHEYRVGLVPQSVKALTEQGHQVLVEHDAGVGIGCSDQDYQNAGAEIAQTATEIYAKAQMIVKVKEPQPSEYPLLRENQILFTFLHLAADKPQVDALIKSKCIAIAYETVTDDNGRLPLLAPMSAVAGRLSIQMGCHYLEKQQGGSGILLGGIPGVNPGKVLILGGGMVGTNALMIALGVGADVTVIDKSTQRLQQLKDEYGERLTVFESSPEIIEKQALDSDLIIGAVLLPGAKAPRLITLDMLPKMRGGSVLVDVAIDQGGCFESSRSTTHSEPVFIEDGIIHYCVTNMPGAVPRTSTFALNNATLPFVLELANKGFPQALQNNANLRNGLNVCQGKVTYKAVAELFGYECLPA